MIDYKETIYLDPFGTGYDEDMAKCILRYERESDWIDETGWVGPEHFRGAGIYAYLPHTVLGPFDCPESAEEEAATVWGAECFERVIEQRFMRGVELGYRPEFLLQTMQKLIGQLEQVYRLPAGISQKESASN